MLSTQGRLPHPANGCGEFQHTIVPPSATYRLWLLSTATLTGSASECVVLDVLPPPSFAALLKKSGCPITRSAASPLVNVATLFHPSTRLLNESAT